MSFLRGIGAGKEGAYFHRESKQAVTRLVDKSSTSTTTTTSNNDRSPSPSGGDSQADVLPEVLKHSLPLRTDSSNTSSPLYSASKWSLGFDPNNSSASLSRHSLNPLSSHLTLPQVPLGSKRWALPPLTESGLASTANELRKDRNDVRLNPEKLKAVSEGLSLLGKAFLVATVVVFGGGVVAFGLAASKLGITTNDDIRTKGKDAVEPRFKKIRERLMPVKAWAEDMSKKWRLDKNENDKEKYMSKELSKVFGQKASR